MESDTNPLAGQNIQFALLQLGNLISDAGFHFMQYLIKKSCNASVVKKSMLNLLKMLL